MAKFTKAPWIIDKYLDIRTGKRKGKGIVIAQVSHMGFTKERTNEEKANARLIAAAPEMYKLLENVAAYIKECEHIYKQFPNELVTYATRMQDLLARIDGENTPKTKGDDHE